MLLPLVKYVQGTFCRALGKWGDVNGDGQSNSLDALVALSVVVGIPVDTTVMTPALADVDGDGQVTSRDALIMLSYGVGLPVTGFRVLLTCRGCVLRCRERRRRDPGDRARQPRARGRPGRRRAGAGFGRHGARGARGQPGMELQQLGHRRLRSVVGPGEGAGRGRGHADGPTRPRRAGQPQGERPGAAHHVVRGRAARAERAGADRSRRPALSSSSATRSTSRRTAIPCSSPAVRTRSRSGGTCRSC